MSVDCKTGKLLTTKDKAFTAPIMAERKAEKSNVRVENKAVKQSLIVAGSNLIKKRAIDFTGAIESAASNEQSAPISVTPFVPAHQYEIVHSAVKHVDSFLPSFCMYQLVCTYLFCCFHFIFATYLTL